MLEDLLKEENNPEKLICLAGFDFLYDQLKINSERSLKKIIESYYSPISFDSYSSEIYKNKKESQYLGILQSIRKYLKNPNSILELCCGNGNFCFKLNQEFSVQVRGVDINSDLIKKKKSNNPSICLENFNIFNPMYFKEDLVVGLHCCGNLSDRVLYHASKNHSDVVCVPCCFGKINKFKKITPISKTLSYRADVISEAVLKTRFLEGYVKRGNPIIANILFGGYKTLINLDRAIFLKENGYSVYLVNIAPENLKGSNLRNLVRLAIVGRFIE